MSSKVVTAIELPGFTPGSGNEKGPALGERLDLVGHVQVRLNVTLGGAQLSLARLFSLAPGETLALDREADAPVDVRLHDKLIARGQLVAVGDQFGVRITDILAS